MSIVPSIALSLTPSSAAVPAVRSFAPRGGVDDAVRASLPRDVSAALATSYDMGAVNGATAVSHVRLALRRPAALQAAFDRLTHDQYVRGSRDFHRWIAPADLRRYGPAQGDIDAVTTWLGRHGLAVERVSPSGMSIEFGGRVADVETAFRTSLHHVSRVGEAHVANVGAPSIPAALAHVVAGVMLSNFFPKPAMQRRIPSFTVPSPFGTYYAVAPPDFAKIYNIDPLRNSTSFYGTNITGLHETIAVVEQTSISSADWTTFRSAFGLGGYHGKLSQIHPAGCVAPGTTGDEGEAALDAEWSSAVAPDANIIEASCAGTSPFEFGVTTTLERLVEHPTPATIFSISYEEDEAVAGFAFEATWTNLVQEGAAEGKSIFVASGDNGTSADRNAVANNGLFVNGLADTAYNVSVGGTDFYDAALNQIGSYWRAQNGKTLGSALSYIPEIPWNDSCASNVLVDYFKAGDPVSFCNTKLGQSFPPGVGGSGSQSQFYTKPDWQLTSVLGVPNDGVRDQPDVSLFASNGIWSHFYVYCMSDAKEGGSPCDYGNVNDVFGNAAGGTSFGSPAFAGIAALIEETQGEPLGNPAPIFYKIAKAQFETPLGLSRCNSTLGKNISPACVFQYVTAGDNNEPCKVGTLDCYSDKRSTMGIGVLDATVDGKRVFAYPAQKGYSLATGLGTVNVTNLLYNYNVDL